MSDVNELARDIRVALASREAARNADDVKRPEILTREPPSDPKARSRFNEQREKAERDYTDKLLSKGRLSQAEVTFLAARISEHLRQG